MKRRQRPVKRASSAARSVMTHQSTTETEPPPFAGHWKLMRSRSRPYLHEGSRKGLGKV